jgi:hypothetical protein
LAKVASVRSRLVVVLAALVVATVCFAGFAGSSAARVGQEEPPTTTVAEVEVGGTQVERGPDKEPVDVAEMARTGTNRAVVLVATGSILFGVGLVLVDVARTPAVPRRQPLPQRPSSRAPTRRRRRSDR